MSVQTATRVWTWGDGSRDRLDILSGADGTLWRGQHGPISYQVHFTAPAQVAWVKVAAMAGAETARQVALYRRSNGWYDADDHLVPGSATALDVDIGCTAATNTLAIRRLDLGVGESVDLDVLYIPTPGVQPQIARQRYWRLRGAYQYENLESGFTARLAVDEDDWVTDYPGLCCLEGQR